MSKQKDKKIITIPKIINITDTLLANGGNIRGSTAALLELAHEFFFEEQRVTVNADDDNRDGAGASGTVTTGSINDRASTANAESKQIRMESNTQKEVAFSMLLKFLEHSQVRIFAFNIIIIATMINISATSCVSRTRCQKRCYYFYIYVWNFFLRNV